MDGLTNDETLHTRLREAEEKVAEYEARYKSLLERLPIGVYRTSEDGTILHANPALARILGFGTVKEMMLRLSSTEVYLDPDERKAQLEEWKRTGGICNFVTRFRTYDNRDIWVLDRGNVMLDDDGNIRYIDGIIQDITEQKIAEEEIILAKEKAEEMSRLKTSFLASMSHELRTPLNGILGFTELLQQENTDASLDEWIRMIHRSGQRLLETLNLILQFSRLEAEKLDVEWVTIRVEEVIDEVISLFSPMAGEKNLHLNKKIGPSELKARIDERMLREILNNLVNNAIKYTSEGGVTIESWTEADLFCLRVTDTGIGIAESKHDVIFEEFRQESEGQRRSFEGTGLGLTVTRRFVELLKGTIEVESEPGVGSAFTVKLPALPQAQLPDVRQPASAKKPVNKIPTPAPTRRHRILVVEDDEINRKLMVATLTNFYRVDSVTNGIDALRQAREHTYDAIMMDINLGKGLSGLDVTRKLRKMERYRTIPIVAATSFVFPGDKEEFLSSGCSHYLPKPFKTHELLAFMASLFKS